MHVCDSGWMAMVVASELLRAIMPAWSYSTAWRLFIFPPLDGTDGERLEVCCNVWHLAIFLPIDDAAGGGRLGWCCSAWFQDSEDKRRLFLAVWWTFHSIPVKHLLTGPGGCRPPGMWWWHQPIRPFVLTTRHPPSSNALRAPGLVDVVHRDRGGLGLPAGQ